MTLETGRHPCRMASSRAIMSRSQSFFHEPPRSSTLKGIGTTGLAMRSGRPMLVMPCAHDQFDNAARVTRLGIARTISRHRYRPSHVAADLRQLLEDPRYSRQASETGDRVRREDGLRSACDALEKLLQGGGRAEAV